MRADRLRLPGAALLAALALGGAAALGGRSLADRADFAFCNQNEVQSLDPAVTSGVPEARILTALYEGLVRSDPATGAPLPGMAERWSVSEDGLSWTFTLRRDSRWTNGDPVTARDFEYSFRRLVSPEAAAPYADTLWCVRGAREVSAGRAPREALGVSATDETTLLIELEQPTPQLPALLALAPLLPVHRGCIEAWGSRWVRPEHIVTNGPFRLVERRVRDRLRLVRHEGYWGRAEVALGSIDAYAAEGITTQLNMYLTGQVDWMIKPPTSLYGSLLGRPDAIRGPQAGSTFLRFNTTRAPFAD
ncbi:MAG TPA: peptide ABC transporter substrate-binding protein, partial [Planctomycetota bacterium]|nr:peptide ABC transporter substrate-binding protein [Planctomycetota bacterium]